MDSTSPRAVRAPGWRPLLIAVVSISLIAVPGAAFASLQTHATNSVIKACANKKTGALRQATKCTSAERAVAWSVTGPRGATGAKGATGASGATGAAGATGAQGAQGAQGIQGIEGPQGPQGADGVAGPPGPVGAEGPQGAQGPQGATGPTGATGPAGPQGITSVAVLNGPTGGIPGGATAYTFAGPTALLTVDGTQAIVGSATADLATNSGTAVLKVNLCYQLQGGPSILEFLSGGYTLAQVTANRSYVTAIGGVKPAAGTYAVGMCTFNTTAQAVDNSDWTQGQFTVVTTGGIILNAPTVKVNR